MCFLNRETYEMAKLLTALFFAAALMLGLGIGPSMTYACPMQSAQTEKAASPVRLAMEDSDDEEEGDEEKSE